MKTVHVLSLCVLVAVGLTACTPKTQVPPRIAIKTLVEHNTATDAADDVVVKLRWSLDKEKFVGNDRYRFPECGFSLYRREEKFSLFTSAVFRPLGTFNIPASEQELIKRIVAIENQAIKSRLLSTSNVLKKEGKDLWKAITTSKANKKHDFPAEPMDLLTLAAIEPEIAEILGLLHVDTTVEQGKKYTYKVVGEWQQPSTSGAAACIAGAADEVLTEPAVLTTPDAPLTAPQWVAMSGYVALSQPRIMTFDKPEQQSTVFWNDPKGSKVTPSPIIPETPVVRAHWQKSDHNFVGYYLDRWVISESVESEQSTRITILPNGKHYLYLSGVSTAEEKPEEFLDNHKLKGGMTYRYRIIGVDIFGRQSAQSPAEEITVTPVDFPPVAPQLSCLESYDQESTLLSDSCPKNIANPSNPNAPKKAWVTPADLKQPKETNQLSVRLKWQWDKQRQARFNATKFRIYEVKNPSSSKPNVCQEKKPPPAINRIAEVKTTGATTYAHEPDTLSVVGNTPVAYYYYCITTVSEQIDDDNDGLRDEDPVGDSNTDGCSGICGVDDDGDGMIDESGVDDDDEDDDQVSKDGIDNNRNGVVDEAGEGFDEDARESESIPSLPIMAYVVDKITPKLPPAACETSWAKITGTKQPKGIIEADANQQPNWEGKLAVRIDWSEYASKLAPDISGYNIYRAIETAKSTSEYVRLNRELIADPIYEDHIEATATNTFRYLLQAVDNAGTESAKSLPSCAVVLPDKRPPKPALITNVSGGNEKIQLIWEASSSDDVAGYHVYRGVTRSDVESNSQDSKNRINATLISQQSAQKIDYTDGPTLNVDKDYFYIVETVDNRGNHSFSLPAAGRAYDINPPPTAKGLSARVKVLTPVTTSKENALVKFQRITPAKVQAGKSFPVTIEIQVKNTPLDTVSIDEDIRAGFQLVAGNLKNDWFNQQPASKLKTRYELTTAATTPAGVYRLVLGTLTAAPQGSATAATRMEILTEIEVVSQSVSESTVQLKWIIGEPLTRTAIWRCEGDDCLNSNDNWAMTAPLLPADEDSFEDTSVARNKTYHYRAQVYDRVGNKADFSKVTTVVVE